jgi:hypothetical protein
MPPATRFHPEHMTQHSIVGNIRLSITLLPASFLTSWLLGVFLVFSDGLAYADWVPVEKPYPVRELQTLYVDPATIHRKGNLVAIWQLTDFRWMQGGPRATPRFLSTTTHKQFECNDRQLRLLDYTEFSHRMAAGNASNGYVDKNMWMPVEPDSINHALWEIVCGQP